MAAPIQRYGAGVKDPWSSFTIRFPPEWPELENQANCERCEAVSAELQVLKADYATLESKAGAEKEALKAEVGALKAKNAALELKVDELEGQNRTLEDLVSGGVVVVAEVPMEVETVANRDEAVDHDDEDDLATEVDPEEQEGEGQTINATGAEPATICSVCGMGFPTEGNLATHMFIHNGVLPFACEFCHKGFKFIRHLHEHRREHGDRPYVCQDCGESFGFQKSLDAHRDREVKCNKERKSRGHSGHKKNSQPSRGRGGGKRD